MLTAFCGGVKAKQKIVAPAPSNVSGNQTGFKGSKGYELKNSENQPTRNKPTVIDGREYSGHALDQMQNRGLFPSVIENTIKAGVPKASRDNTIAHYDHNNNLTVITNSQTGKVVTIRMGS